jgi:hypothetical protein
MKIYLVLKTQTVYCPEQMKNGASSIGCRHLFISEEGTMKIQNTSDGSYSSSVLYTTVMVRVDSLKVWN